MRQKSKKNLEAEKFVDEYISVHGVPPTYEAIQAKFNLVSKGAAWARCEKFRDKMRMRKLHFSFVVPPEKQKQFDSLINQINLLLKK